MTNKAKTYLKNIQEADTEKKLIGIEIAFKQDMTLSCNDPVSYTHLTLPTT